MSSKYFGDSRKYKPIKKEINLEPTQQQIEYRDLCATLGQLEYQLKVLEYEKSVILEKCRKMNEEALNAKKEGENEQTTAS